MIFQTFPEESEELFEQEWRSDDGRACVVFEAVALEDLRSPTHRGTTVDQCGFVASSAES